MLTQEQNRRLTQVGAGTPMGELLRRYWMPVAGVSELEEDPVKPVRLMGEDLVLYRDLEGGYGLIDRHCPHRRADMAFGLREACGLRCAYHGWLYDQQGKCVEAPYEDNAHPELKLREKIRIKAYPVQAKAGLLWAYMGPAPAPLLPDWEPFSWENGFVRIVISEVPCNWLQGQENSVDPVHFEWQHDNYSLKTRDGEASAVPRHEKVAFEDFRYGIVYKRVIEGRDQSHQDWTVGRVCLWPNALYVGHNFGWRVPIDDENTLSVMWDFRRVPKDSEPYRQDVIPSWRGPLKDERGRWIDSHVMNQDFMAWIGQGAIADRTREHLGQSDRGVVMMRQRLLADIKAVEAGQDPSGLIRDEAENRCVPLPAMYRDVLIDGLTREQILQTPLQKLMYTRFFVQAGQPETVRQAYEAATGFALEDEAGQPGQYHVDLPE